MKIEVFSIAIWALVAVTLIVTHSVTDTIMPALFAWATLWPIAISVFLIIYQCTYKRTPSPRPIPFTFDFFLWLGMGISLQSIDPRANNPDLLAGGPLLEEVILRNLLTILQIIGMVTVIVHVPWLMRARQLHREREKNMLIGSKGIVVKWKGSSGRVKLQLNDPMWFGNRNRMAVSAESRTYTPGTVVKVADVNKIMKEIVVVAIDQKNESEKDNSVLSISELQARYWKATGMFISLLWIMGLFFYPNLSYLVPFAFCAFFCSSQAARDILSGSNTPVYLQIIFWFLSSILIYVVFHLFGIIGNIYQ